MQSATQTGLATVRYLIDPASSRFTVQAFATGLLSMFGHNSRIGMGGYEGEIQFVPETYERAFVRLSVQTRAMEVLDRMKPGDRRKLEQTMFEEVLDATRFPTAVYESKQITVQNRGTSDQFEAYIDGDLSFHGITQRHSFSARVTPVETTLRISGEFPLRQSDYGIEPISFAGGALRLKDELLSSSPEGKNEYVDVLQVTHGFYQEASCLRLS